MGPASTVSASVGSSVDNGNNAGSGSSHVNFGSDSKSQRPSTCPGVGAVGMTADFHCAGWAVGPSPFLGEGQGLRRAPAGRRRHGDYPGSVGLDRRLAERDRARPRRRRLSRGRAARDPDAAAAPCRTREDFHSGSLIAAPTVWNRTLPLWTSGRVRPAGIPVVPRGGAASELPAALGRGLPPPPWRHPARRSRRLPARTATGPRVGSGSSRPTPLATRGSSTERRPRSTMRSPRATRSRSSHSCASASIGWAASSPPRRWSCGPPARPSQSSR
jgi:hypothetical protein